MGKTPCAKWEVIVGTAVNTKIVAVDQRLPQQSVRLWPALVERRTKVDIVMMTVRKQHAASTKTAQVRHLAKKL